MIGLTAQSPIGGGGVLQRFCESPRVSVLFENLLNSAHRRRVFVEEFLPTFPGARVLDLGCGNGWLFDYLPKPIQYVGYDADPQSIAEAQARFGEAASFFCEDIRSASAFAEPGDFHFAFAFGLMHHLTDAEATQLIETVSAQLRPGGVLITIDGVFTPHQNPLARWLLRRDRGRVVRTRQGYEALVRPLFTEIRAQVRTDLLRVPYTHLIMYCRKA